MTRKTPRFLACEGFLFRSAALPATTLDDWLECADAQSLRDELKKCFSQPWWREALWIASPALAKRFQALGDSRLDDDWIDTLFKYLVRTCFRATPFGLFAAVNAGKISDTTELVLCEKDHWIRRIRLDSAYLLTLIDRILHDYRLESWMPYVLNSTLYRLGDTIRYHVARQNTGEHAYVHAEIEWSAPIQHVLELCRHPCTVETLLERLSDSFPNAPREQLTAFLENLITKGILVSALSPPVTSSDALTEFLARFPAPTRCTNLHRIRTLLQTANGSLVGEPEHSAVAVAAAINEGESEPTESCLQVDTMLSASVLTLSRADVEAVSDAMDVLWMLSESDAGDSESMDRQAPRFLERWGEALVPLAIVADEEIGLDFGGTDNSMPDHLRELDLRPARQPARRDRADSSNWIYRRVLRAIAANEEEVVIGKSDLAAVETTATAEQPPRSISATLSVYQAPESRDRVLWIEGVTNSATSMIGRFCSTSPSIEALARQIADEEQKQCGDSVLAEIVHLPRPRLGNITARPVLRMYEIPYAGVSGAPEEHQLPLDDLFVGVDRSQTFYLWSVRLQRRVIPVLSCAHNFGLENGLRTYRLLCSIAHHGRRFFKPLLPGATNLPRVPRIRFGRCILRVASWHVEQDEFDSLKTSRNDESSFAEWANQRRIPRLTTYGRGDQTLVLDLRNPWLRTVFLTTRHHFPIILREASPAQLPSAARDIHGRPYRHEIVLPFVSAAHDLVSPPSWTPMADDVRRFAPGSQWLSLKIYIGAQSAERLLSNGLAKIVQMHKALTKGQPWFFLRYADPDIHLRVRFSGPRDLLLERILPAVHDWLDTMLSANIVQRVQSDTYVPEIRRYGGEAAMPLVEQLFHADSAMHVSALRDPRLQNVETRLIFGVRSAWNTLDDFGFDDEEKLSLLTQRSGDMIAEFGGSSRLKKQIGDHYRHLQSRIELPDSAFQDFLEERSHAQRPIADALHDLQQNTLLKTNLTAIVASLIHMSLNRLFVSHPRQQEMLVYEFARRWTMTQFIRARS